MNLSSVVYIGFWTDYQRGRILGHMLTLDTRSATVLMAVLVVLIGFAAGRSWRIWAFCLHTTHHLSRQNSQTPTTFPIRQQQVILRNSGTAGGALLSLVSLPFNQKRGTTTFSKKASPSALLVFFVLAHWMAFVAFRILTSLINAGNTVRSTDTPDCGEWIPNNTPSENASVEELTRYQVVAGELILNGTLDAESYVRGCYGQISEGPGVLDCRTLTQRSLEYFTEMARCPFHDDICLIQNRDQSAFVMDTGNVSFAQLGLNSKYSERLFFRRRTVCSPITVQPFLYSKENVKTELLNAGMTGVDPETYGVCSFFQISGVNASYAFQYNSTGYEVISHFTFDASLYPPLPILQTQTPLYTFSVVTLRAPGVVFLRDYSDPLFYVQTKVPRGIHGFSFGAYQMTRPINAVACQGMAMLCSKVTNYCTDWSSLAQATFFGDIIGKLIGGHGDDEGSSAVVLVSHALIDSAVYHTIADRSASSLQASRYLAINLQMRLADEQWKLSWKTPARDLLELQRFRNAPNASLPDSSKMCNIVKFHSAEHTTLRGAWIIVIFAYVVFVTIFSFGDSWVPYILKNKTEIFLKPWENNEKLRLLSEAKQMEEPSAIPVVKDQNTGEIAEKGFLIPRKPVPQSQ
ncbi:hypothetical protein BDD12DRAFT_852478 [Trichophaea hybrida]|nr:hypothetical protein BDD12DRAFT_852478 [Trichophaea hybrida]